MPSGIGTPIVYPPITNSTGTYTSSGQAGISSHIGIGITETTPRTSSRYLLGRQARPGVPRVEPFARIHPGLFRIDSITRSVTGFSGRQGDSGPTQSVTDLKLRSPTGPGGRQVGSSLGRDLRAYTARSFPSDTRAPRHLGTGS